MTGINVTVVTVVTVKYSDLHEQVCALECRERGEGETGQRGYSLGNLTFKVKQIANKGFSFLIDYI